MRVLIVDDEEVIREGLRALIDWEAEGFDEVRCAAGAEEATALLERELPELIITDIVMPGMSGLDFAKKIRARYPSVRFVILTGFEKFDYAKEAIGIGVANYLVKPIFPEELRQVVREQRAEIEAELKARSWNEQARERLHAYRPIVKDRFWGLLLAGELRTEAEVRVRAEAADIRANAPLYGCAAISILREEQVRARYGAGELPLVRFAIRNIVEEIHGASALHLAERTETMLIVALSEPVQPEAWQRTAEAIERTLKIAVGIGAGRPRSRLSELAGSADEAAAAVTYLALLDRTGFIRFEDVPSRAGGELVYPYDEEKELLETLRYKERAEESALAPFLAKLDAQHPTPQELRLAFVQLLAAVYRLADESGISTLPAYQESVSRLERMTSYSQMQRLLGELFAAIAEARQASQAGYVDQLVERTQEIVRARYGESDLSVARIAGMLCITPNYLSRIFHQKTGTTCVEYMTECRLEEAKRLLRHTAMKSYEIAERVGYANAHYFSFLFKKNVGCAPSEYRERHGGPG